MIQLYVNTASTPGGDGTTNNTVGATRAYASTAEALAPFRLTTLTDQVRIYCSGTAADTSSLDHTPMEFMTTPTNFIEIIGDNTIGKWNTSAYRIQVTNSAGLYNQYAAHVRMYNIQIMVKVTDGNSHNIYRLSTANNDTSNGAAYHIFKNCIARQDPTSTSGSTVGYIDSDPGGAGGVVYRINCLAYGCGNMGYNTDATAWAAANVYNYNCTAYGNLYNWVDLQKCVNCLCASPTSGDGGGFISAGSTGHSNNASSESTAVGANARNNQTFSFVDAANGDFHLLASDTGAKGFGLSDPGGGLYNDDVDGGVRTGSWDIGFDQYGVAGGGGGLSPAPCAGMLMELAWF